MIYGGYFSFFIIFPIKGALHDEAEHVSLVHYCVGRKNVDYVENVGEIVVYIEAYIVTKGVNVTWQRCYRP